MIRTYLTLEVIPEKADDLVDYFRKQRILETSTEQPGCLSAQMTLSPDRSVAIVTATWEDEAAYATWTSRSDRATHATHLNECLRTPLTPESVSETYLVVHASHTDRPSTGKEAK